MKKVIVADVHQQLEKVQSIIAREGDAKYYWLGDWFDDYNDCPEQAAWTAKWLYNRTMSNPEDEFLLGNHDAWYLWPGVRGLMCSGNTPDKAAAIRDCMDIKAYQDRVKLWSVVDDWVLSHAGFSEDSIAAKVFGTHDKVKSNALKTLQSGIVPPLLDCGRARGGPAPIGGITWLDFGREFKPLTGVYQIVGHTRGNEPRWYNQAGSRNLCLDTHTNHYAVLEDGELTIKENV